MMKNVKKLLLVAMACGRYSGCIKERNIMKKRNCLIYLFLIFLLASCGKQEAFEEHGEDYVTGYDDNLNEFKGAFALSDSILYIHPISRQFIYCLDLETGESYPLCSKPNCFHNSEECNAYETSTAICLWQDKLITTNLGEISYLRMDGSGRELLGEFMDGIEVEQAAENGSISFFAPIVHRGYIYRGIMLFDEEGTILRFVRLSVSGGNSEVIWEQKYLSQQAGDQVNYGFVNYQARGNQVYFTYHDEKTSTIRSYDIETSKLSLLHEGSFFDITYPVNGQWYWMTVDGVYCWNPKTGEERCLVPFASDPYESWRSLRFYEGGFLLPEEDAPHTLAFYDWEGNVTHRVKIDVPPSSFCYLEGHLEHYLVCQYGNNSMGYTIAVLDTDLLDDPSLEWMLFEFPKE